MRPETSFTGPELCARPARDIVAELRKGHLDPADLVTASATRIEQVEPTVNATVTTCFTRARDSLADLPDHAAANARLAGWLAGLPIGIKDLSNVSGVRSTFATLGLKDHIPATSDPMVERLESRGGIVMGKTNTPEFGAGGNSTNLVFGSTRNPWDTRLNAGGSSGGAAVSLATGEVWLSQGSDLMGSLRTPAAHCGVVGLRPSPGSAGGGPSTTIYNGEALSGPMARDIRDAALFLDAMTGWDPRMPLSRREPETSYQSTVEQAPRPPRIAFSEDQNGFSPVDQDIRAALRTAMQTAARAGAEVTETCPDLPYLNETFLTLRGMHYASTTARQPENIRKHYDKTLSANIAYGLAMTTEDIFAAPSRRSQLYEIMRLFLQDYDVLALPTVGTSPGPVEEMYPTIVDGQELPTYEHWLRFSFLSVVTLLPALAMPIGFTETGLPISLQLIGPPRGEATLLQAAFFIEQALNLPATPIDPIRRH